jgi:hypothetical protein
MRISKLMTAAKGATRRCDAGMEARHRAAAKSPRHCEARRAVAIHFAASACLRSMNTPQFGSKCQTPTPWQVPPRMSPASAFGLWLLLNFAAPPAPAPASTSLVGTHAWITTPATSLGSAWYPAQRHKGGGRRPGDSRGGGHHGGLSWLATSRPATASGLVKTSGSVTRNVSVHGEEARRSGDMDCHAAGAARNDDLTSRKAA